MLFNTGTAPRYRVELKEKSKIQNLPSVSLILIPDFLGVQ